MSWPCTQNPYICTNTTVSSFNCKGFVIMTPQHAPGYTDAVAVMTIQLPPDEDRLSDMLPSGQDQLCKGLGSGAGIFEIPIPSYLQQDTISCSIWSMQCCLLPHTKLGAKTPRFSDEATLAAW